MRYVDSSQSLKGRTSDILEGVTYTYMKGNRFLLEEY